MSAPEKDQQTYLTHESGFRLLKFPPRRKPPATPPTFTDPTRQRVVDVFVLRQLEPRDYENGEA